MHFPERHRHAREATPGAIGTTGPHEARSEFVIGGTAYLARGEWAYPNYWGGVVFVPVAIVVGILMLAAFARGGAERRS
jgi:hypothetical protein